MHAQPLLQLVVGSAAAGQQRVRPVEGDLVPVRQVAFCVLIVDAADEVFGETGLTGLVETDLLSEAAIGDPGVS